MFTILGNVISSFFYGVLMTIVLLVIIFLITKLYHNRIQMSLVKMISVVVISFFFLFQATLFMGCIKAKGYIASIQPYLLGVVTNKSSSFQQGVSVNDLSVYADLIGQEFPMFQSFFYQVNEVALLNMGEINSVADYVDVIVQNLHKQVNFYLWRRCAWILSGWVLLLLIMLYKRHSSYANDGYSTSLPTATKMKF